MITNKETDTILAALRLLQETIAKDGLSEDISTILTNGFKHPPATEEEIDALCERLNIGGSLTATFTHGDKAVCKLCEEIVTLDAPDGDAPDWMNDEGDTGCHASPDSTDDGEGGHEVGI